MEENPRLLCNTSCSLSFDQREFGFTNFGNNDILLISLQWLLVSYKKMPYP